MNMVVAKRKHLFESHRPHLFFELRQLSLSPVVRHCRSTVPNNNDTHTPIVFFLVQLSRVVFFFSGFGSSFSVRLMNRFAPKYDACRAMRRQHLSAPRATQLAIAHGIYVWVLRFVQLWNKKVFPPFFFLFSFGQVRHEEPSAVDFFFFVSSFAPSPSVSLPSYPPNVRVNKWDKNVEQMLRKRERNKKGLWRHTICCKEHLKEGYN